MSVPNAPQQQAAPQSAPETAPQSNDEAIGSFARGFLGSIERDEDPDQLTDEAPVQEAPPQVEAEAEAPEQEAETPTQPEVPMVEVDIDGEKYTIPEKVKHRVMADKDYRQKTMELAAERKQFQALTATAAQVAQQAQQLAPYHARLQQMTERVNLLNQALTNPSPELAADPVSYNRVQGELAILLHQRDQFANGLNQQVSQLTQQQQAIRAQQLAIDAPKLYQEIPDLQKPESVKGLTKYLEDAGLPQEAFDFVNYSTVATKLAWKAMQYDVMVADQAKAKAKLQEKVKDLPGATQSSRAGEKGANTKQLQETWKKNGGRPTDPAFTQLLRSRIGR